MNVAPPLILRSGSPEPNCCPHTQVSIFGGCFFFFFFYQTSDIRHQRRTPLTLDDPGALPPALPSARAAAAVLVVAVAAVAPLRVAASRLDLVQRPQLGDGLALQQLAAKRGRSQFGIEQKDKYVWNESPPKKKRTLSQGGTAAAGCGGPSCRSTAGCTAVLQNL